MMSRRNLNNEINETNMCFHWKVIDWNIAFRGTIKNMMISLKLTEHALLIKIIKKIKKIS